MNYVFCDTMIYLHYQMFTEIDFSKIINNTPVTLVVPEIVIKEIDDHKDSNPQKKIRDRASRVHATLFKYLFATGSSEIRKNYAIYYLPDKKLDFSSLNLDERKNDHRLIAAILNFKQDLNNNDEIYFISQDFAPSFTAKSRGLSVFQMPDELKLADEQTEFEKKIKQLESRLAKYENAIPQLSIRGSDKAPDVIRISAKDLLCFTVSEDVPTLTEKMSKFLPRYEIKFPTKNDDNSLFGRAVAMGLCNSVLGCDAIEKENADIKRYMHDRDIYFEQYNAYLKELELIKKKIFFKVSLHIINSGHVPAEKVSIYLHFPDGFEMYTKDNLPKPPKPPQEPVLPRTAAELLAENMTFKHVPYDFLRDIPLIPISPFSTFSLKKTNSYEVEDEFQYIQHGDDNSYVMRDLFLVYDSINCIQNFHAEYIFRGKNLPEAQHGTINFIFDL